MVIPFYMIVFALSRNHQVMSQEGRFAPFGTTNDDKAFTEKPPVTDGTTRYIAWDMLMPIPAFGLKEKIKRLVVSKCLRLNIVEI